MNETFWGLYEAQIAGLHTSVSPEETNMILLETAKFLVEQIDLTDETMAQYNKFGIRKLFASYNVLGNAVLSFYKTEKARLDPAARSGAIGQKLDSISKEIVSVADELVRLRELEKELLEKEKELAAAEKELEDWKQKVIHLRNIEENAANEIHRYQEQYHRLEEVIARYEEDIGFWEEHLGENSRIVENMKNYGVSSVENALSKIETLKMNIHQGLKTLDDIIKEIVSQEAQAREDVLRRQNKIV